MCAGNDAKRLVGMLLPKGAVDDLLQELRSQQASAGTACTAGAAGSHPAAAPL